jgi:hypothetical protein
MLAAVHMPLHCLHYSAVAPLISGCICVDVTWTTDSTLDSLSFWNEAQLVRCDQGPKASQHHLHHGPWTRATSVLRRCLVIDDTELKLASSFDRKRASAVILFNISCRYSSSHAKSVRCRRASIMPYISNDRNPDPRKMHRLRWRRLSCISCAGELHGYVIFTRTFLETSKSTTVALSYRFQTTLLEAVKDSWTT